MRTELRGRRPWEVPGHPERPERPQPTGAPAEAGLPPWLAERLFERRIVVLTGPVTGYAASTAAATLLSLDWVGAGPARAGFAVPDAETDGDRPTPVQLHLAASDGDLDAVFTVIDAIDSMHAPVHAVATGEVGGAALGVYAAAHRRLANPHARFRLAEPNLAGMNGTADDVTAAAARHLQALEHLILRIAEATGQPRSRVEDDLSKVRLFDVAQAQAYGLVHEVRGRDPAG